MLDPIVRTYDPKFVIITYGAIIFTGFASGTFIQVARSGDLFEKNKGSDGTVDRTNKNAFDFRVTVTLKQTSLTNDLLSTASILDAATNVGALPLLIKQLNGTTLFFAPQAWIAKDPDDEFGDASGNRQWLFDTGFAEKFTGGSII